MEHETSLTEKEDFHSHLNMEDVTGVDYMQSKRVRKDKKSWINSMICLFKVMHCC